MFSKIMYLLLTLHTAADTACRESGTNFAENQRVLQVAVNRSKRWGKDLYEVLTQPYQFAHGCRKEWMRLSHYVAAYRAMTDTLDVDPGIKKCLYFCADREWIVSKWEGYGWTPYKKYVHIYWQD